MTINHRQEVAALLAEIERLKAEVASHRGENDALRDACRAQIDAGAAGRVAALYQRAVSAAHENTLLRSALAAGPAALRIDARDGEPWGPYKQLPVEEAVATVERAQAEAMKEER